MSDSARIPVAVANGVAALPRCGCALEVDGEGKMWVTHEKDCFAVEHHDYRKACAYIIMHFGDEDITKSGLAEAVKRLLAGHQKMNNELSAQEEMGETLGGGKFPRFRRDIDGERRPNTPTFSCCNG